MRIFALLALGLPGLAAAAPEPTYVLPEPPAQLMLDEAVYAPFARNLAADADRLLAAHPPPAREKLLLGLRVHLALHFGDSRTALRLAALIQAGTPDPAELHIFARGGHGYRFAYDAEVSPRWRALLAQWLALWKD